MQTLRVVTAKRDQEFEGSLGWKRFLIAKKTLRVYFEEL
jgi:hypothetical protein